MVFAYILIIVETMDEHTAYLALRNTNEIQEVFPLFGEYDIIAKIETETKEGIGTIVEKIKEIKGVLNTKTLYGL